MRRIARNRGGRLLSEFAHSRTPMRFRCAHGHEWEAKAASIDYGLWCPACKEQSALAQLRAIAERWGGTCLSERIRRPRESLEWRCAVGHRWKAPAYSIRRGSWCPICRRSGRYDLARMRRVAAERGGECLSRRYVNADTRLRWRCRSGHEWWQKPAAVIQGHWCRECERGWGRPRRRLDIGIMHEMAEERGGACLSSEYNGIYHRLRWSCARGHLWETAANNVRRGGWCPVCAHAARGTLEGMRALAVERGGRCLSRTWDDHKEPLLFACGKGHRFRARANVVKSGVWCPACGEKSARQAKAAVQRL